MSRKFHSQTLNNLEKVEKPPFEEEKTNVLNCIIKSMKKHEVAVMVGALAIFLTVITAKWDMLRFVILAVVLFEASWFMDGRLANLGVLDKTVSGFIERLLRILTPTIIIYCILRCLDIISDDTSPQIVASFSIAIGLATQSVMSNLACAAMLVMFRPFHVGDVVEIDNRYFVIVKIGVMFTHADDFNQHRVLLPNSKILDARAITNWSENKFHIYELKVNIRTGQCSCAEIRKALENAATLIDLGMGEILKKCGKDEVIDRDKTIVQGPLDFTSEGMVWIVKLTCQSTVYRDAQQHGNAIIHDILHKAGIQIFEFGVRKEAAAG